MHPAEVIRRQLFGDKEYERLAKSGAFNEITDCSDDPILVREEFARESDVSFQLKAFGAGQAFRYGQNGVVDYDVDRMEAEAIISRGNELYRDLPEHLRNEFGSWEAIELAAESGELKAYYDRLKAAEVKAKEVVKSEAAKPPEILEN